MVLISPIIILIITINTSLLIISSAQPCSNYTFTSNKIFKSCIDLPSLNAHLHWNSYPKRRQVKIAYRATQSFPGWIAWAINPTGEGMIGSQALVAFMNTNGSMTAYTTAITSYDPPMLPEKLSFPVKKISAEYSNDEMIIYAELKNQKNGTEMNHVWQSGDSVYGNIPKMHPTSLPHLESMGQIVF